MKNKHHELTGLEFLENSCNCLCISWKDDYMQASSTKCSTLFSERKMIHIDSLRPLSHLRESNSLVEELTPRFSQPIGESEKVKLKDFLESLFRSLFPL